MPQDVLTLFKELCGPVEATVTPMVQSVFSLKCRLQDKGKAEFLKEWRRQATSGHILSMLFSGRSSKWQDPLGAKLCFYLGKSTASAVVTNIVAAALNSPYTHQQNMRMQNVVASVAQGTEDYRRVFGSPMNIPMGRFDDNHGHYKKGSQESGLRHELGGQAQPHINDMLMYRVDDLIYVFCTEEEKLTVAARNACRQMQEAVLAAAKNRPPPENPQSKPISEEVYNQAINSMTLAEFSHNFPVTRVGEPQHPEHEKVMEMIADMAVGSAHHRQFSNLVPETELMKILPVRLHFIQVVIFIFLFKLSAFCFHLMELCVFDGLPPISTATRILLFTRCAATSNASTTKTRSSFRRPSVCASLAKTRLAWAATNLWFSLRKFCSATRSARSGRLATNSCFINANTPKMLINTPRRMAVSTSFRPMRRSC